MAKTSTERVQAYRARQRKASLRNKNKVPKTGLQRSREYRARRKVLECRGLSSLLLASKHFPMAANLINGMGSSETMKEEPVFLSGIKEEVDLGFDQDLSDDLKEEIIVDAEPTVFIDEQDELVGEISDGGEPLEDPLQASKVEYIEWGNARDSLGVNLEDISYGDAKFIYGTCKGNWTERLISLIKKRPILYDRSRNDYSNKRLREKNWDRVCFAMVHNWTNLPPEVRAKLGKEIQRQWQCLRASFRRELRLQKSEETNSESNRTRYIYFDSLKFLIEPPDCKNFSEVEEVETSYISNPNELRHSVPLRGSILDILREKAFREIDEDKCFLLSMIPVFKKLSRQKKLKAKTEILNVINMIEAPSLTSTSTQSSLISEAVSA